MIGRTNVGGGGNTFAFIVVTYPAGSVCTCSDGTRTIRAKGTTGSYLFSVPYAANWKVYATNGIDEAEKNVNISYYGQSETVNLTYIIPYEYQAVDYVESNGNQYIDTLLIPITGYDKIECEFSQTNTSVSYSGLFGSLENWLFILRSSTNKMKCYFGNVDVWTLNMVLYEKHSIALDITATGIDSLIDGTIYPHKNSSAPSVLNSYMFACNDINTGVAFYGYFRIYSFKMYKGGEKVRDFIPCYRKSDNVAGLFDTVYKRFYASEGSSEFVAGGDVT